MRTTRSSSNGTTAYEYPPIKSAENSDATRFKEGSHTETTTTTAVTGSSSTTTDDTGTTTTTTASQLLVVQQQLTNRIHILESVVQKLQAENRQLRQQQQLQRRINNEAVDLNNDDDDDNSTAATVSHSTRINRDWNDVGDNNNNNDDEGKVSPPATIAATFIATDGSAIAKPTSERTRSRPDGDTIKTSTDDTATTIDIVSTTMENIDDSGESLCDSDHQRGTANHPVSSPHRWTKQLLGNDTIQRYSRQMLIIGVSGQQQIQQSSVLVIGAGGIGSTVLLYLAGAGIPILDVMDHDCVELSNLHRQIIHTQPGMYKAISAQQSIQRFNPTIRCRAICEQLTTTNAIQYIKKYDIIIDATDNVTSRYIINDACVLLQKPLISGSAITTQGQLTVYNNNNNNNNNNNDSCCYRCMYPNPNVQKECHSCNDAGVLGPVPGLIGILQAMEAIKLITSTTDDGTTSTSTTTMQDKLLMYDGISCSFLTITKPKKNPNCVVCGNHPTITSMEDTYNNLQDCFPTNCRVPKNIDENSAGTVNNNNTTDYSEYDISCIDYYEMILKRNVPHILMDVRVPVQYDICSLSHSINIPLQEIISIRDPNSINNNNNNRNNINNNATTHPQQQLLTELLFNHTTTKLPIYCICRRGIASREAVRILHTTYSKTVAILNGDSSSSQKHHHRFNIYNVVGGLVAWQQHVDPLFPTY